MHTSHSHKQFIIEHEAHGPWLCFQVILFHIILIIDLVYYLHCRVFRKVADFVLITDNHVKLIVVLAYQIVALMWVYFDELGQISVLTGKIISDPSEH